jgi:hypothetical protein
MLFVDYEYILEWLGNVVALFIVDLEDFIGVV